VPVLYDDRVNTGRTSSNPARCTNLCLFLVGVLHALVGAKNTVGPVHVSRSVAFSLREKATCVTGRGVIVVQKWEPLVPIVRTHYCAAVRGEAIIKHIAHTGARMAYVVWLE
jgi:hypothetical protein